MLQYFMKLLIKAMIISVLIIKQKIDGELDIVWYQSNIIKITSYL